MKVVIVGGGAGGISTASNIRKLDNDIEITVITRDNKVAYSPCAIPYVLSGTIESFDDIVMRTPEDYKEKNSGSVNSGRYFYRNCNDIILCLSFRSGKVCKCLYLGRVPIFDQIGHIDCFYCFWLSDRNFIYLYKKETAERSVRVSIMASSI